MLRSYDVEKKTGWTAGYLGSNGIGVDIWQLIVGVMDWQGAQKGGSYWLLEEQGSNCIASLIRLINPTKYSKCPKDSVVLNQSKRFDWSQFDEKRAFGASVSLYEKNPLTGVNAGEPVADVWGVVGRNNNGVLALADGVNWGEGARLAARCAVRGAIDHMNEHIESGNLTNTTMRDMRDAGGALGPVDGRNPQLHNLTCSMTFVEEGDVVFITSDGVSDNFDPVVGKFCVIKRAETDNKENSQLPPRDNRKLSVATKDSPTREFARPRPCAASLPCVDAASRHELMLVRMRDIIANGIDPPKEVIRLSPRREPLFPRVTASVLSHRLIQFATHLSQAKRRTLENPELYKKEKMTKSEQRARLVSFRDLSSPMLNGVNGHAQVNGVSDECNGNGEESVKTRTVNVNMENFTRMDKASCCATVAMRGGDRARATINVRIASTPQDSPAAVQLSKRSRPPTEYPLRDIVEPRSPERQDRPISPYEQLPNLTA
ncbi:hypothetical protein ANCCEY_14350 [Ancylostoma ceylanicum]|uniref:PPM-type phosphatase domain-containing protein n=1 Tax=Ancylostoma ceylanicum TaxID=53326 RepID=A0A0D6L585_9BILA|nr:hypothetical protein ANCCEY_14350 [Ancylostoma ceylanicum]